MILFRGKAVTDYSLVSGEFVPPEGESTSVLTIFPTRRRVRTRIRQMISLGKNRSISQPQLETLSTLTRKLSTDLPNHPEFVSPLQSIYILKQLLASKEYYYLDTSSKNISALTLESLLYAITEYKRYNVLSTDMEEDIAASDMPEAIIRKAGDFWRAYISYYNELDTRNLVDDSSALVKLISMSAVRVREIFKAKFPGIRSIILEGFTEFSSAEIDLLSHITDEERCSVYINLDYKEGNVNLFAGIKNTIDLLTGSGFQKMSDTTPMQSNKFLEHAAKYLFNDGLQGEMFDISKKAALYAAENQSEETAFVCQEISSLLHSGRYKPGDIAFVVNDISLYAQNIRGKFREYGLPLNLTDRIRLNTIPEINYFVSLLTVAQTGYYYKDIARIISSRILETSLTVIDFYEIASEAKVTRGYKSWMRAIDRRTERIINDKGRLPEFVKEAKLAKIAELKGVLEKLRVLSEPFSRKLTPVEFEAEFQEFCVTSGLRKNLLTQHHNRERVYTAFKYFFEEFTATIRLYKDENSAEQYPADFYFDMIRTIVRSTRFNMREEPGAEILVSTPEEIRGLNFKVLFIGGLIDGNFPFAYRKKLFFGKKIPGDEKTHMESQGFLFYQTLGSFTDLIYLSYPRYNNRGENSISVLLGEFESRFAVTKILKRELQGKDVFSHLQLKRLQATAVYSGAALAAEDIYPAATGKYIEVQKQRVFDNLNAKYYNGIIEPSLVRNGKLTPRISVSGLERFNKCHQQYFYTSILGLKQQEEPEEGLKAAELGTLIHTIFYRFYSERNPGIVEPVNEFPFIKKIALEEAEKYNLNGPLTYYDMERILGPDDNPHGSLLWYFLLREAEEEIFTPVAFELEFKEKITVGIGLDEISVEFRGVIDRVEVNDERKLYAITDYKTGKPPTPSDIKNGKSLQLPFYASVAGKQLGEKDAKRSGYKPGDMFYYRISKSANEIEKLPVRGRPLNKNHSHQKPKDVPKILDYQADMIANTREFISKYIGEIYEGKFNLLETYKPDYAPCSYCDFHTICRVMERKASSGAKSDEESDES